MTREEALKRMNETFDSLVALGLLTLDETRKTFEEVIAEHRVVCDRVYMGNDGHRLGFENALAIIKALNEADYVIIRTGKL
jgi:hypothetical protein